VADWASVGAAVFTAAAALAAFLTARQGREIIEASRLPILDVQALADPIEGTMGFSAVNTGGGVARGGTFILHALGEFAGAVLGEDGFVRQGERVAHQTTIGPVPVDSAQGDLPDLAVMVSYRDAEGFAHYRTHSGHHYVPKTWLRRRPRYPKRGEVFAKFFPHVDLDAATKADSFLRRMD
jgi:hypothetical protein